jgi:hypothetical protein
LRDCWLAYWQDARQLAHSHGLLAQAIKDGSPGSIPHGIPKRISLPGGHFISLYLWCIPVKRITEFGTDVAFECPRTPERRHAKGQIRVLTGDAGAIEAGQVGSTASRGGPDSLGSAGGNRVLPSYLGFPVSARNGAKGCLVSGLGRSVRGHFLLPASP